MTSILRLLTDAIFVFSVIFIWLMIIYQFVLTIGGFRWRLRIFKEEKIPIDDRHLPSVSILIPARNEEKVISNILEKLRDLDYPQDKIEIIIINDGSLDKTKEVVERMAVVDERIKLISIPAEDSGRGKGAALNRGLMEASNEAIAVYDADNIPENDSLLKLCKALISDKRLAAATGKFRAYNKKRNLLTRLVNIESIAFQWIIQAGRWFFFKISFLPGTNYVIWKSILQEVKGWNEEALTEDSELTFRIYEKGYLVKFIPNSTTWEQEPENLTTWVRQRTRWARGNNYILSRYGKRLFRLRLKPIVIELLNFFYLYYFFIFAILFSDILFVLSLFKVVHIRVLGPYKELWALAFLLFLLEILIALSFEKEDSPASFATSILAYFIYTKLWIFIVLRSLVEEYFLKRKRIWMKTERFDMDKALKIR